MPRFDFDQDGVVVVIGSGAGGGTLATDLCRAGVRTVVLEAGGHHQPGEFIDDEWPSFNQLAWLDDRTTSGTWRVATDFPSLPAWTCKTVGGTTVHWAGCCPRFKDWELRIRSEHGPIDGTTVLDWPITLADLEPYYDKAEDRMGVTRTNDVPPLPANNNFKVMGNGAARAGYADVSTGRMAINSMPRDGRPATIQDGFNFQGDKQTAHWSTLTAELPKAQATGNLDLRPMSHAFRIAHNGGGKVTGVHYFDADGNERVQKARAVCVAGNAIETARLLLNSDSSLFPDGLANSSDQVGRNLMVHSGPIAYGRFDQPLDSFITPPVGIFTRDPYPSDERRGFRRGYLMNTYAQFPINFAHSLTASNPDLWGEDLMDVLDEYAHWGLIAALGEVLPDPDNRVTLADETDDHGVPVARVTFSYGDNDRAVIAAMRDDASRIMDAAGAHRFLFNNGNHHVLGTCRMGTDPATSVVDPDCRSHDVDNLWICDGSVFPTVGAVNPSLTIQALATRTARQLVGAR
jgi:choline dehydrogenase-like flavoprotein